MGKEHGKRPGQGADRGTDEQYQGTKSAGDSVQRRGKPGGSTLAAGLQRGRGQTAERPARTARPTTPAEAPDRAAPLPRTAWQQTMSPEMDMAHRGGAALVEHESASGPAVQRQEAHGQAGASGPARARASGVSGADADVEREADESSQDQRLVRVHALLAQHLVGPFNEIEIEQIWDSFGPRVLDVAERHRMLWNHCVERGAKLDEIPAVRAIQSRFRADVQALGRQILRRNDAEARAELMALGINDDDGAVNPAGSPIPVDMQDDYAAELQERAGQLVAARGALAELREVPVGFRSKVGNHASHWELATFDPAQPPSELATRLVPEYMRRESPVHAWDEVMAHHQRLAQAIAILSADSPALYSAVSGENDDRLFDMAAAEPAEARRAMAASLSELLGNIRATIPKIGTDLDDRDLAPLHERLFAGEASASGTRWSRPMYQRAARAMLSEHARSWTKCFRV